MTRDDYLSKNEIPFAVFYGEEEREKKYLTLKDMKSGKQEDLTLEKRVSITPETAKNIIGLGLKVSIEKNYANHLGIHDDEYKKVGVEIKNSSIEVLNLSDLLIKESFNYRID